MQNRGIMRAPFHIFIVHVALLSGVMFGTLAPAHAQAAKQDAKLDALNDEIRDRKARERKLKQQAFALGQQKVRLQKRVISLAQDLQNIDAERDRLEQRLGELAVSENQLDANLQLDRVELSKMLAGLQAMHVESPPAFAVHPDDALSAVQGALVLASVVPSMQSRADKLRDQLTELSILRRRMDEQSNALIIAEKDAAAARQDLKQALAEKSQAEQQARREAENEASAIARLVKAADSLKDLSQKLQSRARQKSAQRPNLAADGRFGSARGLVPMPVSGRIITRFGDPSSIGSAQKGIAIEARPGAQITAPYDARVLYSGPFRQYGSIVILAVAGRYQMILAGMENTTAYVGQELLAGEPIGALPEEKSPHGGVSSGRGQLYMELRRDGQPIDPAPWFKTS
jgi:septal ring factor EnvC (AmiA/AmiB activator)